MELHEKAAKSVTTVQHCVITSVTLLDIVFVATENIYF